MSTQSSWPWGVGVILSTSISVSGTNMTLDFPSVTLSRGYGLVFISSLDLYQENHSSAFSSQRWYLLALFSIKFCSFGDKGYFVEALLVSFLGGGRGCISFSWRFPCSFYFPQGGTFLVSF